MDQGDWAQILVHQGKGGAADLIRGQAQTDTQAPHQLGFSGPQVAVQQQDIPGLEQLSDFFPQGMGFFKAVGDDLERRQSQPS